MVVEKLHNHVYKDERVDLVDHRARQLVVLDNVDQCEVLSHPLQKVVLLLLDLFILSRGA